MGEQNMQNQARALIQQASQDPKAMEQLRQIMELAAAIQQEMQAMQQSGQQSKQQSQQKVKAALGTKLDYLNKLKGVCPEGSEKVYLKDGGCMCKPKVQKGAELKEKPKKMNEVQKFKAEKAQGGVKVAYKDIDSKTYKKLPEQTKRNADSREELATSWNNDGTHNISHKPTAADSTTIDRKHMSPEMQKKYPLKKTEKNACGSKMKKKK